MSEDMAERIAARVKASLEAPLAQRRAAAVEEADLLTAEYPGAVSELDFSNAFELLVATVLSAQTTDVRVNLVTPELFGRWPTPQAMAEASLEELEDVVRPLGMFRRRATALSKLSSALVEEMGGEVPSSREELIKLAGVGRKTAHVVLGSWFGVDEITVDTHVERVTRRLAWADAKTPLAIEKQLWQLLPDAPWTRLCHELILHGRRVCHARNPACGECVLNDLCPSSTVSVATQPDLDRPVPGD